MPDDLEFFLVPLRRFSIFHSGLRQGGYQQPGRNGDDTQTNHQYEQSKQLTTHRDGINIPISDCRQGGDRPP